MYPSTYRRTEVQETFLRIHPLSWEVQEYGSLSTKGQKEAMMVGQGRRRLSFLGMSKAWVLLAFGAYDNNPWLESRHNLHLLKLLSHYLQGLPP